MSKRYFQIFLIAIICAISGCGDIKEPYMVSNFQNIRKLEKQDHDFCISLNLDSGTIKVKSALYWRCRLALAKHKIRVNNDTPEIIKYNFQITDLVTKISLNLAESKESVLSKNNDKMDKRHHQQCLDMGFESDSLNQAKTDDYFSCRKMLIDDQQLIPPYGNAEYSKYPNRSYSLGYAVDKKIEREMEEYAKAKEKYPACVSINLKTENFKRCTKAQDQSRQCFSEISKKKFKREAEEKIICQRKAYVEFPNSLLKEEDNVEKEIEKDKALADIHNKSNFMAIGLNEDKVKKFKAEKKDAKERKLAQEKLEKSINSKDKLYSGFELTKLRQKYIFACQKEADTDIAKYVDALKKSCDGAQYFEVIEE